MSRSDPSPAVQREVRARAGEACECCGQPMLHGVIHHRQGRRGRHTDNRPVNLMVVIPRHHDVIHEDRAGTSRQLGHIVSKFADPADVPIIPRRSFR